MATKVKRSPASVRVRVDRSFGSMYAGEEFDTLRDAQTEGWIRAGLLLVLGAVEGEPDGAGESGPGEPETDVQRGEQA